MRATTCGSLQCPYCIQTQAWLWSRAIQVVQPDYYAVVTGVPAEWSVRRAQLTKFFRTMDIRGHSVNACYNAEVNRDGVGCHMNIWWWGTRLDDAEVSEVAQRVGWGQRAYSERWRGESSMYGVKEVQRDPGVRTEQVELTHAQLSYLERNGGRLFHARRSFWRDGMGTGLPTGTMKATLEPYRGLRLAS